MLYYTLQEQFLIRFPAFCPRREYCQADRQHFVRLRHVNCKNSAELSLSTQTCWIIQNVIYQIMIDLSEKYLNGYFIKTSNICWTIFQDFKRLTLFSLCVVIVGQWGPWGGTEELDNHELMERAIIVLSLSPIKDQLKLLLLSKLSSLSVI